jgi:hypothetical protein
MSRVNVSVKINTKNLQLSLKTLQLLVDSRAQMIGRQVAYFVLRKAAIRAPRRFNSPGLKGSFAVERGRRRNEVNFGFNTSYAEIMDRGWRTPIIRPKRAKALFIPLTRRGARRGPLKGQSRVLWQNKQKQQKLQAAQKTQQSRLLRQAQAASGGGAGVGGLGGGKANKSNANSAKKRRRKRKGNPDFIFRMSVKTRKVVRGAKIGPNRYFSGTIKDMKKDGSLERAIARQVRKALGL